MSQLSNVESLLTAIAKGDSSYLVEPQSRVEALLYEIYMSGGGGGTGDITRAEVLRLLADKVDKLVGYGLISDGEAERLKNVDNYDDSEVRGLITDISNSIIDLKDTIKGTAEADEFLNDKIETLKNDVTSEINTQKETIDTKISLLETGVADGTAMGKLIEENILLGDSEDVLQHRKGIDAYGNVVDSASYNLTVIIPCLPSTTYYARNNASRIYVVFYDENGDMIYKEDAPTKSRYDIDAGVHSIVTHSNARYIRIAYHNTDVPDQVFGRISTDHFVEYNTFKYDFSGNALYNACSSESGGKHNLSWMKGYRIATNRPSEVIEKDGYSVGYADAKEGDIIKINLTGSMPDIIIPVSQKLGNSYNTLVSNNSGSEYYYVVPFDMTIAVCVSTIYEECVEWSSNAASATAIKYSLEQPYRFSNQKYSPIVTAMTKNPSNHSSTMQKPFTLLHMSDIHGSMSAVSGMSQFKKMFENIDGCIITGDVVASRYTNPIADYAADELKNVMLAIGNHDVYDHNGDAESHGVAYDDVAYWATATEKYNKYFKPSIANWNVTQPSDAESNGLCYYYKDYDLSEGAVQTTVDHIRLIVLDAMAYDNAQHAWLVNALSDARTNEYTVIIAEHFAPLTDRNPNNAFDTNFHSLMRGMEREYAETKLTAPNGNCAVDAVDDFIDDGGEFVCWLCGHYHYGAVDTVKDHERQIYIAVETGNTMPTWNDMPRSNDDATIDLINLVSVDTYNKTLKIARIGAEYDDHMRHRGTLSINYVTRTLIASE